MGLWYRDGTIALTNGSPVVIGTGTSWVDNVHAGDALFVGGALIGEVQSVSSNTQLTLVDNATSAGSGFAYKIQQTAGPQLAASANQLSLLTMNYQTVKDQAGAGKFGDGTAAAPAIRSLSSLGTGFYLSAANTWSFSSGGTRKVDFGPDGINSVNGLHTVTATATTSTTLGNKDARVLLTNPSVTANAGGEIVLGATGDTPTGRYVSAGADIQGNVAGAAFGDFYVATKATGGDTALLRRFLVTSAGHAMPAEDNLKSSGGASNRWSVVYAGTGSINTSDASEKQQIAAIPETWLDAWADVNWARFKFNDAVAEKGIAARWHTGLVAQTVHAAFEAHGLDAFVLGLCCLDEWEAEEAIPEERDAQGNVIVMGRPGREAGQRWGLRYDECFAMEAAYQRRRIAVIEARLAILEAGA